MPARLARSSFVSLTLVLSACGSDDVVIGPTREEAARVDPTAQPVLARPERPGWARTPTPEPLALDQAPPLEPERYVEETIVVPGEEPPPRPRNLGDDLRVAIGDVSSCLDVQTAAGLRGAWSVSVSATALPSGRLQRASVSAGSVPRATVDCIRARVEAASLATPIEGAPRTVSTTLRYEVSAQVTTETRTRFATDEAPPGNTRPAAVVLPALGSPGPAPGARQPGVTLPALAEPGPAPGAVAPSITLPALAPPVQSPTRR